MASPTDTLTQAPAEQQTGIQLLLDTLRQSPEPVHVVSFGSARPLAVAWNREPELLRRRIAKVHLCAGGGTPSALEWNVALDPHAMVCLLRSGLPIALYPCATFQGGPGGHPVFQVGPDNGFWSLPDHGFMAGMDAGLRRYLAFAFGRSPRADAIAAVQSDAGWDPLLQEFPNRRPPFWASVWETAVWSELARRRLASRAGGPFGFLPADQVRPDDTVVAEGLVPCTATVRDDGWFELAPATGPTTLEAYCRPDPHTYQAAVRQAVPTLFQSYRPTAAAAR